jgi:hypothetical protein
MGACIGQVKRLNELLRWCILFASGLTVSACGGSPTAPASGSLSSLAVAGPVTFTTAGQSSAFVATATSSNGTTSNVTADLLPDVSE